MPQIDPNSWKLIATGEQGDHLTWVDDFEPIETARFYLMMLEGDAYTSIDWSELLHDLPDLEGLDELDEPPLYRELAFEELGGFLVLTNEPIEESPGRLFNQIEIYIDVDREQGLLDQFNQLGKRLELAFKDR